MLGAAFGKGALNDLGQEHLVGDPYDGELLEQKINLARGALEEVMDSSADFASVFDLVIHSVFIKASRPSRHSLGSHGGSTSGSIGAIWFSVSDKVCHRDLVEMFVHELTHHLLFVDELNCPQFNYDLIVRPEHYARSAILKRQRPLDKVVHSIAVGATIVDARKRYLRS
ncbi:MAG: HEXXH motif-containing putative peptide modification protein, partial [Desulfobulbaceae bacterium]|nr:HEXXH motif-containing putative peptide modification protein [Desulfobulbaceae bacterium]